MKFTLYNPITCEDEIYFIEYSFEPYTPAKTSGHPDTWSAPEGGGFETLKVVDITGVEISSEKFEMIRKSIVNFCIKEAELQEAEY